MPKGGEQLVKARREEILNACAKLYEDKGFKETTLKDIAEITSFSRPSIYNYFKNKEEVFLGLLEREYAGWGEDMARVAEEHEALDADELAACLAKTVAARVTMLKIVTMNLYEIEDKSSLEHLIAFKKTFKRTLTELMHCVEKFRGMDEDRADMIRYMFMPYLNGIYPYIAPTSKQCEAMQNCCIEYKRCTVYDMTYNFLKKILN